MNKAEFLSALQAHLVGLPEEEWRERVDFYREMIEDRMEDGLAEEEAVAAVGDLEQIAEQILAETPLMKLAKQRIKPKRRMKAWEIVLLVLGFPVWGALLIAAVAVLLALYSALWAVLISLWAVFASVLASGVAVFAAGVGLLWLNAFAGLSMLGAGLIFMGLSVFFFFGCRLAVKGTLLLTRGMGLGLKRCFMRKEAA